MENNIGYRVWRIILWSLRIFGLIFAFLQLFVFAISPISEIKNWLNFILGVSVLFWIVISIKKDLKK